MSGLPRSAATAGVACRILFPAFLLLAPISAVVAPVGQFAIARVYLENREADGTATESEENLTAQPGDSDWDETVAADDDGTDPWDGDG